MTEPPGADPRPAPSKEAVATLRETAGALDIEDILDLCYSFAHEPVRLTVYLDVLRSKGGQKAQAAACLVCFDLAEKGDPWFESEFLSLVPVMLDYTSQHDASGLRPIDALVGDNEYLHGLLVGLEKKLIGLDPRADGHSGDDFAASAEAEAIEVSLLDDDDLAELELDVIDVLDDDTARLQAKWEDALDRFLSSEDMVTALTTRQPTGFWAETKSGLHRVEGLREDAISLADHVDDACRLLPLAELFLAAHHRARNLFGRRNKARDLLVQAGLTHVTEMPFPPDHMANWLLHPTASPFAWEKVAELLLDYVAFLGGLPEASAPADMPARGFALAYLEAGRPQPPPDVLRPGHAPDDPRARRRR